MPLAINRAVATSRRVLGTSAKPRSRSFRTRRRASRAPPRGPIDATLVRYDLSLALGGGEVELEGDEPLPRARLEVLETCW